MAANYAAALVQYNAEGGVGVPVEAQSHANNGRKTWVLRSSKAKGGLIAYVHAAPLGYKLISDITGISKAASAVVLSATAGRAVGQKILFGTVADMPEIAGLIGTITAHTPGVSFTVDINSSGFALAGGAGIARELLYSVDKSYRAV